MNIKSIFVVLCACALFGCEQGMAPKGMAENEVQDAVKKLSPDEQIKYIEASPMPAAEKQRRISEIRAGATTTSTNSGAPK